MTENYQWYIVQNGVSVGPMSHAEIIEAVDNDRVTPQTMVWRDGFSGWKKAEETELNSLFASTGGMNAGLADEQPETNARQDSLGQNEQTEHEDAQSGKEDGTRQNGSKSDEKGWYVLIDARRFGPFTLEQVVELFKRRNLNPETMVWAPGFDDWQQAIKTEVAVHMRGYQAPQLPPIDNYIVWAAAFSPMLGSILTTLLLPLFHNEAEIQFYTQDQINSLILQAWFIKFSFQTLLGAIDLYYLRKAGYKVVAMLIWMVLLFPGYLFLRSKRLGLKQNHFLAWLISMGVMFLLGR